MCLDAFRGSGCDETEESKIVSVKELEISINVGTPKNWWFIRENRVKIADLGVPTILGNPRLRCFDNASKIQHGLNTTTIEALAVSKKVLRRAEVLIHMFYLCMLIFPSLLFGLLIFLGSEHGDDRCPYDLDALLVWFGALGLAVLVMDCANDGAWDSAVLIFVISIHFHHI